MNESTAITAARMNPLQIRSASTDDLRTELARSLQISAEQLVYLATVWRELERRGEDLSTLRTGIAAYLPEIAAGRLDPNAVIKFAGQATLLNAVSSLPIEQQAHIVNGASIPVISVESDGSYGTRDVPVEHMTAAQVRIAFDRKSIRSIEAQRALLDSQRLVRSTRTVQAKAGKATVRPDFTSGTILVGRTRVTPGELISALAQIYFGREANPPETTERSILIQLTDDEHRAIKMRSAEGGITIQRLVRGTLGAAGVLG